jgi:hypothetical protein
MASEPRRSRAGAVRARLVAAVLGLALLSVARAQSTDSQRGAKAQIYTCIDSSGKKITSDRPIPECSSRDQRLLNSDGSVNRIVPPTPTADERADMEARQRDAEAERVARMDAIRRDKNLLSRFPDEVAHNKARAKALDDTRKSVRISLDRIALLKAERKPLLDEAEFYIGKPLPTKLKLALDANDASLDAQNALVQNQQAEVVRINAIYDAELLRLKKLWAGAPAGSLGPLPGVAQAAASGPGKPATP